MINDWWTVFDLMLPRIICSDLVISTLSAYEQVS